MDRLGTHGPESYVGSAVQLSILDTFVHLNVTDKDRESIPNIVFVHALNPYGFATNRRVNEDNIDINRNFLTEVEFKFVKQRDPDYARQVELDAVLNPKSLPFRSILLNDIYWAVIMAQSIVKYGFATLKRGTSSTSRAECVA